MRWSSRIGLVDLVSSPVEVCRSSGHAAAHISNSSNVPDTAAIRSPMPNSSATLIPARPSMNSQSAQASPAQLVNIDLNGPCLSPPRKPLVGEPPLTQAPAELVA